MVMMDVNWRDRTTVDLIEPHTSAKGHDRCGGHECKVRARVQYMIKFNYNFLFY
jgi:hypothetical protein